MSLLSQMKTGNDVKGEDNDMLGGSRTLPTDVYELEIKHAYYIESKNGAIGIALRLETKDGQELRFDGPMGSTYLTNRNKENFYVDKRSNEQRYLPGYLQMTSLALLTVGKPLEDLATTTKVIDMYNPDEKKEVPTEVPMIMDLIGQKFYGGVEQQLLDKTEKNNAGAYVPTGETFEKNELVKVYRLKDKMTKSEIESEVEIADEDLFMTRWSEKNKDKIVDKTSKDTPKTGAPRGNVGNSVAGAPDRPKAKLFG